jgi:signal transduction histidine kinase
MTAVTAADPSARRTRRLKDASIAAAIAMTAITIAGRLTQTQQAYTNWFGFSAQLVVGVTIVVVGHVGWNRRPESRIGPLLVIAGLLRLTLALGMTELAPLFTISLLVGENYSNVLGHALITFPSGRAANRVERALIAGVYTLGVLGFTAVTLFHRLTDCRCPQNLAVLVDSPDIVDLLENVTTFISVFVAAGVIVYAVRKYRRATPAGKRALAPVYASAALAGFFAFLSEAGDLWFPTVVGSAPWFWIDQSVTLLAVLGFLVGLLRTGIVRSAVGDLVVELGAGTHEPGELADALAERLKDPTLQVAYRVGEGYIDDDGRPFDLPPEGGGRAVTLVEADGQSIAALIHDEVLRHEPEVVEAVVAAARLAIANERLRAEIRAQLEEVRASRQRIVEAGDHERRRVERNLHDGAQQRLVSVSLALGMLREQIGDDRDAAAAVEAVAADLKGAIAELRELARGIHPAILTEEGLAAAVESLADRSRVPVRVRSGLDGDRLPETVEAAAYFVVSESLANVAKYAEARTVEISIERREGRVTVCVSDDGVGGADPEQGSGLLGLADRVAAVGGTLAIASRPGEGTQITAEIPIDG